MRRRNILQFAIATIFSPALAAIHQATGWLKFGVSKSQVLAQLPPNISDSPASILYQEAEELINQSQFPTALQKLQSALDLVINTKEDSLQAVILNDLGYLYNNQGDYQQALKLHEEALIIRKHLGDRSAIAQSMINIGASYEHISQYPKALDYYQQALLIVTELKELKSQAFILGNLGSIHRSLGQYEQAIAYFQQSILLFQQIGDRLHTGIVSANLSTVYIDLHQYQQGLKMLEESLAIARSENDLTGIAQTLFNIGSVYLKLEQYPAALTNLQESLELSKKLNSQDLIATNYNSLGKIYQIQANYEQAGKYYLEAFKIRQEINNLAGIAVTLNNIGIAQVETGYVAAGITTLNSAINALEALRPGLSNANKISIFDRQGASTYGALQKALFEQEKFAEALEISERGRARALVELLAKHQTENLTKIPPPTIAEIKQIAQHNQATLVEYSITVDHTGKQAELLIWVVKPTGELFTTQVNISKIVEKQDYIIPFLSTGVEADTSETKLTNLIESTRAALGVNSRSNINFPTIESKKILPKRLQKLYQILIEPIAKYLPTDPNAKVVFIPHQELLLVPFAALKDVNGKYLIEKHTISISPAIQVLQLVQQQPKVINKNALVVGITDLPSIQILPTDNQIILEKIPAAATEARAIAQLLKTQPLIGKQATKATVLQLMPKVGMIHLATHGIIDDILGTGVPGAIALTPTGTDRGLLTSSEIATIPLKASLIVLSACHTGQGRISGDGIIGLSRSLISAGAKSVIVSLWNVPDTPTAALMIQFHQQLQQHQDKASALRQSMISTMQKYPDPRDWAAFILIGEL